MNWYLAKLVFQIICGDGRHTPQFDEQLRLIKAANAAQALDKSNNFGSMEEETFFNNEQQIVQWKFIAVSTLIPIAEYYDGAEVHSIVQEHSSEDAYLKMVKEKACNLMYNLEAHTSPIV